MTPDPKLVEALASWRCTHDLNTWAPCVGCLESARRLIDRHRLAQLPEEPSGWTDSGWASSFGGLDLPFIRVFKDTQPWIDNVPVYILPGDPKEVDDG